VLAVRDELTEADSGLLAAADLVLLQAVRPGDARIAVKAFGMPDPAGWLGRLEGETFAVAAGGAMRWAVLAATPVERALTMDQHLTTSMRRSP
jgi:hypothetical protein